MRLHATVSKDGRRAQSVRPSFETRRTKRCDALRMRTECKERMLCL
jgi:hypothetical protein